MPRPVITPEKTRLAVAARVAEHGARIAADQLQIAPTTLARLVAGKRVMPDTIARLARNPIDRVRKAEDFDPGVISAAEAPRREQPIVSWDLERIRAARDAQMRGDFKLAVRLAEAIRTDDTLFTAYHNRIAPQSAVALQMIGYGGARGDAVLRKARSSIFVKKTTLEGINGTLANHGIAIGYNHHETNKEGTRTDFRHVEWPLEWVLWNPSREVLETATRNGIRVPIVHGDGRWVIYRKFDVLPWTQEAALLPAAFVWAAHANGIRDWAAGSKSHGEAKVIGELPERVMLQIKDADGNAKLSNEAFGFLQMLRDIMAGDNNVGIRPFGSKTEMLTNTSTMYQVFSELILSREKAASRIYLGTDATLGAAGGAPGVDISLLFGVASTKAQGDLTAIEQGLNTGVYQPWTAINEGDSRYSPCAEYQLPDPDAERKSLENKGKLDRLCDTLDKYRAQKMTVDQTVVDAVALLLGIAAKDIPRLAAPGNASVPINLAPTDVAKVVRVREARQAQGLPPFGDARDEMTITQFDAKTQADAKAAADIATKAAPEAPAAPAAEPPKTLAPMQLSGATTDPKAGSSTLGGPGSGPHEGAPHPHGGGVGGGSHSDADAGKAKARAAAQTHFDEQGKRANDIAKSSGLHASVDSFLNKDRHAVSKAERDGAPNETSDKTTAFLKEARKQGADYKGQVYRGTTPAELDQIIAGGKNKTTWSVSKDPEGSAHFAKKGGVLLVIPKNSGAVPVDHIEGSNTFNEALVPKGSRWKIGSERSAKGVRIVTLDPVHESENAKLSVDTPAAPPHDDADIDDSLDDPKPPKSGGDGGNLELWGDA